MSKVQHKSDFTERIAFLDYLRVFAFTSVLIGHKFYGYIIAIISDESIHQKLRLLVKFFLPLFQGGGAGVVVFFIISGYIITSVLQTENTVDFIIKRIFRIYPVYVVAVLLQGTINFELTGEIPAPSIIIPQLLLIGDIFGTPYTLDGVEWTLRLEVLFYTFMVILHKLNITKKYSNVFPQLLLVTILILGALTPIPSYDIWSKGYLTIYGPFLLLGCLFYLKESNKITHLFLLISITILMVQYHYLIKIYQPQWIDSHFAIISTLIFYTSWKYKHLFKSNKFIDRLSELTYSIYIFHNWAWNPIKSVLQKMSVVIIHPDIQVLISLILICFLIHKFIEKPSMRIGKKIAAHINIPSPRIHMIKRK